MGLKIKTKLLQATSALPRVVLIGRKAECFFQNLFYSPEKKTSAPSVHHYPLLSSQIVLCYGLLETSYLRRKRYELKLMSEVLEQFFHYIGLGYGKFGVPPFI